MYFAVSRARERGLEKIFEGRVGDEEATTVLELPTAFTGVVTLEVFSEEDLLPSLASIERNEPGDKAQNRIVR
jgi:hypothetical protein